MNKNSNTYVIIYSIVMVVLVSVGLALTSEVLKDRQRDNANVDTMRQILSALHIQADANEAVELYKQNIVEAYLVSDQGEVVAGSEGTGVNDAAFKAPLHSLQGGKEYPVFVANLNGETKYILGLYGAGLWGPIWGYIALDADANTVFGTTLSHASETPGLGAEISTPHFLAQFPGKTIYTDGEMRSIAVVKPGKVEHERSYVDGISGGTITSQGVDQMLIHSLKLYEPYLNNLRK